MKASHTKNIHHMIHVVHLGTRLDESTNILHWSLHGLGDLVDVLWLDNRFQVILQHLCEVVWIQSVSGHQALSTRGKRTLQLGTTEILENLLPVGRVIISSQVGLQFTTQDLQRSTLPNTVCSHETKDLARTRHGQAVELETVGRVAMGHLRV